MTLRDDRGVSSSSQKEFSVVISDSSVTHFPLAGVQLAGVQLGVTGPFSSDSFSDNSVVRLSATRSILLV